MFDYKKLYFDGVQLDIADVLSTVGFTVSVGGTVIAWAHSFGDLGGTPNGLDFTPLSATTKMEKSGLMEQEQWELNYFWNKDDFGALEAMKASKQSKAIIITFSDGTTYTNNGVVAANFATGSQVNSPQEAKAVINLSNADGWTYTPST